jgi:hypothetical protein
MSSAPRIVLALALAIMAGSATAQWNAPAFCKGLECPKYTVVKSLGDGVELRRYEPSSWVSTKGTGMEKDAAMRGSFMKLFDYISGANSEKAKIPMTAPVLTKIEPGQGPNCESTFTMSFYNPYNYQGANAANVPKPTGTTVIISSLPAMEVYVMPYSGWSTGTMEREKAQQLIKKLEASKEPFNSQFWFTAGYDSPYQLANRHNEVWVPKAGAAAGSTASEAGAAAKAGR